MSATPQSAFPDQPTLLISSPFERVYGKELLPLVGERARLQVQETGKAAAAARTDAPIVAAYLSPDALQDAGFANTLLTQTALQWVHLCTAGADLPLARQLHERGVTITTSSGANAKPVANSAIGGLLALARGLPHFMRHQMESRWQPLPRAVLPRDLDGATATIIGMGPIGQEIARLCQALGMHTIGIRRSTQPTPHCDEILPTSQLNEALPRTDWLIVACPLTDETRHLIDRERLGRLPSHACVINISRGAVIAESDLVEALREGAIAGACCDVFEVEPLPAESPLWQMPNVIITPHSAGISLGFGRNAANYFFDNLARWLQGEAMINVVRGAQ